MLTLETALTRVGRRTEKTRRILMEVALGLFYEKGIYWTKIEDITEGADIGKGTFYRYFDTKEALLHALLQQGLNEVLARVQKAIRPVKAGPKLIERAIQAKLDFLLENPEYLLLFHQVRGLLQLKTTSSKGLRDVYDGYLDRLEHLIRPALTTNGRSGTSSRHLAMALSALTSGLLTYHLLFGRTSDITRRRRDIQSQIAKSIRALL